MDFFDYANAKFVRSGDGPWELHRDWATHPPTQSEIEVLFVHLMRMDRLLTAFVRHFAAGNIQTADGLDSATYEEVMRFAKAVGDIIGPPRPLHAEDVHTASLEGA